MTAYSLQQIVSVLQAECCGIADASFVHIATDSRRISFPETTLFFALPGAHRHGMQFVPDAWAQGVRLFVVDRQPDAQYLQQGSFLVVKNVLQALQQLAAWKRQQFQIPVIGITGSNGKTIVKEWLYEMLGDDVQVVRSPKSYNSQIGVPLSVWAMEPMHELGIFEAGISTTGEMVKLEEIIQPTIGLFTMLGDAHQEGFASRQQKLEEKFRLFDHCTHLICNTDDTLVKASAKTFAGQLLNWGTGDDCWMKIEASEPMESSTHCRFTCEGKAYQISIPFTSEASVQNALHAVAFLVFRNYDEAAINERLGKLLPVDMRLQWKKAIHDCYLLNDSYSNDFTSLQMALHYLQQQGRHARRTCILSDVSSADLPVKELYPVLAGMLQRQQVSRLIAVGPAFTDHINAFESKGITCFHFATTYDLLAAWHQFHFQQEDILLKGGRLFGFEAVAALLEAQLHETVLEINLTKLASNLRHYRSKLKPSTKLMVMVKAFGYGSGDAEIARLLQHSQVDYLAVAYADEGVQLRRAGVTLPVMVLNCPPQSFPQLEQYNLEPEIYSIDQLQQFIHWCQGQGLQHFPIHLKIDTGMHRLGFERHEIAHCISLLQHQSGCQVKSVFTHLVASEDADADAFTQGQLQQFDELCTMLKAGLGYPFIQHAANTAAISRHPQAYYDMVRLGVGLYGGAEGLEPVMKLMTTVAQVKQVKAGETVGYGRHFVLPKDSVIATVRIGYADGYRRQLGNGLGRMWLRGAAASVAGNVCMDMTMLDVSHIDGVKAGDEVEVFGPHISMAAVARQCGTIVYELMTGLSQRVKRVYVEE